MERCSQMLFPLSPPAFWGGERNDLDHYDRDRSHDGKGAEPREQALPPSYPATASTASLA